MTVRDDEEIHPIGWLRLARNSPAAYWSRATEALERPDIGPVDRCIAHAVRSRCAESLLDAHTAMAEARRAIALDTPLLDDVTRAEVHGCLVRAHILRGAMADALTAIEAGERIVRGAGLGLLELHRFHVEYRLGSLDEALATVDRALAAIPVDRPADRARALNNRGLVRLYLGGAREGLRDLELAEALFASLDQRLDAADAAHNRAMMLARLGDLPAALATFDSSEQELAALGEPIDALLVDRAEVMVLAGLADDVVRTLEPVIERLDAGGMAADAGEARLYLAMARLELSDPRAVDDARDTAARFRAAGRDGWARIADDLEVHAMVRTIGPGAAEVRHAAAVARALDEAGMRNFAPASWLRTATVAEHHGDRAAALDALTLVAGRRGTLPERVAACEAAGRRHLLLDDPAAARRSFERGLRLLERNRALFEATELRIQASGWGEGLARALVELAWDTGDASRVFDAAERWRATALTTRAPLPPADTTLADLLADYRAAHATFDTATRDEPAGGPPAVDAAGRLRAAERAVVAELRRRSTSGTGPARGGARASVPAASTPPDLDVVTLVELVTCRGELAAVIVAPSGTRRLVPLGPLAPVVAAAAAAARGLRQLASVAGHPAGRMVQRGVVGHLERLRHLLVDPVLEHTEAGGALVVVPETGLHAVPWGVLTGRVLSVAPSARSWAEARCAEPAEGEVVVVAGPGLDGAESEAHAVAALHRGRPGLAGADATVPRVLGLLDGAALAHIACHAHFEPRTPLLSFLRLADGPLTGFDLERVPVPPSAVVLSACSTAQVSATAGGEALGLSTLLLAGGSHAVVASMLPLPDRAAVPVLEAFHDDLRRGATIGAALAARVAAADLDDPAGLVVAASLTCYGRSDWRLAPRRDGITPGA